LPKGKVTKTTEGSPRGNPVKRDEKKEETIMVSVLKVKGMSCQHCVMSVTKALSKLEGVQNVKVDLQKGEVQYDNTKGIAPDKIVTTVEDAGYQVVKG
jgi:copper ion binding protein